MQLARSTEWRQGYLLTTEAAIQLQLLEPGNNSQRAVVITHDCDIANPAEPALEIIIADVITPAKPDPQLSYAKNPRRLHLVFEETTEQPLILELQHCNRQTIARDDFNTHATQDNSITLPADNKRTLKQWLAARYGRPAFPDAFENHLRERKSKRTAERQIAKILEPEAQHLVGLFFDLGEQRGIELAEGEPYVLSISVVYDAIEGATKARSAAERVAEQLHELFESLYGTPDQATKIALESCEAVADTHISLADLRRVDQWRLEYVSLQDDDHGDFLAIGEMPA